MLDSWGKIPSGILLGNFYELGQFDECLASSSPATTSHFIGQYCLSRVVVTVRTLDESSLNNFTINSHQYKGIDTSRLVPALIAKYIYLYMPK